MLEQRKSRPLIQLSQTKSDGSSKFSTFRKRSKMGVFDQNRFPTKSKRNRGHVLLSPEDSLIHYNQLIELVDERHLIRS
jgi:hypothetical protein